MLASQWFAPVLIGILSGTPVHETPQRITLKGEVVDAESGKPIPCRISIQDEKGSWHFPETASAEGSAIPYRKQAIGNPAIAEMHVTLSAHPFSVRLPAGRYTVTAERGKEYHPWQQVVSVGSNPVELTIRLRRWIDMNARGWYSGDTHTHRTLDELPNVMLAEDLNAAFPLLDWVREAFVPPIQRRERSFRDPGPQPIRIDANHVIVPRNTEYEIFTVGGTAHTLGAFFVINHRSPLDLGAPPVGPIAARAHREGALIELDKHNWPWSMALVPVMPVDLYELSNNHIWQTDFAFREFGEPPPPWMKVERDQGGFTEQGWIDFGFRNYYALLDCGFRLRPTAGTASGVHPVPLGFGRVYVRLNSGLDASTWLDGLNAGRSFVTTGPMLFATLEGQDPGHRFVQPDAAARDYKLGGAALSSMPLERLELVVNGEVIRSLRPLNRPVGHGAYESPVNEVLRLDGTSWIAVRCFEPRPGGRIRFAHSGPFFVDVAGRPLRPRRAEVEYLLNRTQTQINRSANLLPAPALEEYRQALRAYQKLLEIAR